MRTLHLLILCAVFAGLALPAYAQDPPTVKVHTIGISSYLAGLDDQDGYDVPSNGLPNTAPNSKVYLEMFGTWSDNATGWTSSSWTLTSVPAGSAATISSINDTRASFVPDIEGQYTVEVTGTDDASLSNTATIVVNVASYVGVGGIVGTAQVPQCSVCHSSITATWAQTPHAVGLSDPLDEVGGHFRESCLGCHTTGSIDANAGGDGFLALMPSSGWTFPTELKAGNYDSLLLVSPTLAERANVQCESCHGPGSAHIGNTADNRAAVTVTHQQCITCHDAPTHHVKPNEWRASGHINSVGEPDDPEHMNRGSQLSKDSDCARCHTSAGFLDVHIYSTSEPDSSFSNAPYDDPGAIGCATCHNPHELNHEHQLRMDAKDLCASCHAVRVSGYSGLHSSHQGPMINGEGGKEFSGYTYANSAHTAISDQCVTCHMAAPEDDTLEYLYGGHTFKVVYDNGTADDKTDDVLNTTGCVSCHVNGITLTQVEETQTEIQALLDELKGYLKLRTDGRPIFPSDTTLTTTEKDAHWNWYFVTNDNSFGVHNYEYSKDLLTASIEEMKKIVSVEPLDNSNPNSFALEQNFPNPFNPSTTIQFSIPSATNVRLAVYDASGQLVNVLLNGYYRAGSYQVTWNGTSIGAQRFAPSGVYFYRIETDTYTASKKMVLMK